MARKQTIDSDQILDAAETVLLCGGVHGFTLDAVAAQAGISKGGLVYRFPSKDQLIQTLLERELTRFSHDAEQQSGRYGDTPGAGILGHISAIGQETEETASRAIGLLTALVHAPAMLAPVQTFYRTQLARLAQATPLTKRLRIAFLAAEGVFLLRGTGFAAISREERQSMLDDICDEVRSAYSNPKTTDKPQGPIQAYTPSSPPFPPTPAVAWLSANGVNGVSLSAERRHARAAHIIATATQIIRRDGIATLTHRAVAAEAGVPLGSTTYHFKSLDDLLNAVMREAIALFREDMFHWLNARRHDDPCEVLTQFILRGTTDIQDLAREYELFTAAISRPSLRPMALEWSNTVIALLKLVVPDDAALPLGTLMNGFFIRALLAQHEHPLTHRQIYPAVAALYHAFR